ncbi:MAG: dTMP kinase [Gammaproteobacteria bacterium]|nr:dTMP kinase [Gammaproteobacteria bacterium]
MTSSNRNSGFFITLEGIEGVGKTTHTEFLAQLFRDRGRRVRVTREPGGTRVGEAIREVMLHHRELAGDGLVELLLVFAARAQHLGHVVRPALAAGETVICDRFTDATYAYQGGGRGIAREWIEWLERTVQAGLRPDLTLLFDAPVDVGMERARARGDGNRFEGEDSAFFGRVRQVYLEIASAEPVRIRVIDVNRPMAAIRDDLRKLVDSLVEK